MGDTFRRISLGQRRKFSSCTAPTEYRSRKRSTVERPLSSEGNDLKTFRSGLKLQGTEIIERNSKADSEESRLASMLNLSLEESKYNMIGKAMLVKGIPKRLLIEKIFACMKEFIRNHEILVQLCIVLPIIFTALYILYIEKKPLVR